MGSRRRLAGSERREGEDDAECGNGEETVEMAAVE